MEGGERLPRCETLVKLAGSLESTPNDLLDGIAREPITFVEGGLRVTPIEDVGDAAEET